MKVMKHRILRIIWLWLPIVAALDISYISEDGVASGDCTSTANPCSLAYFVSVYQSEACNSAQAEARVDRGTYTLATSSYCDYALNFVAYYDNGGTWEIDLDPITHVINGPTGILMGASGHGALANGFTFRGLGADGEGTFNITQLIQTSDITFINCVFEDCYAPLINIDVSGSATLTVNLSSSTITGMVDSATVPATVLSIQRPPSFVYFDGVIIDESNTTNPSIYCLGNGSYPVITFPSLGICSSDAISCTDCTCDSLTSPGECQYESTCLLNSTCGKYYI